MSESESSVDLVEDSNASGEKIYRDPNPLPEPLNSWRKTLKEMHIARAQLSEMQQYLVNDVFPNLESPFDDVIRMCTKLPDYKIAKNTGVTTLLLREFRDWINARENKEEMFGKHVDEEIQFRAFTIGVLDSGHTCFLEIITELFHLKDIPSSKFLGDVRSLLYDDYYKNAAHVISLFSMQDIFNVEDVLIPLLLQDKGYHIQMYLKDRPDLQKEFVENVDILLDKLPHQMDEYLDSQAVRNIRREKFQPKPLQKFVARLLKDYQLPPECAPNLSRCRGEGSLRYVVFKRYSEQSMNAANFEDYVQQALDTNPNLALYLVKQLANFNQLEEAAKWMYKFNVPKNKVPNSLYNFLNLNPDLAREFEYATDSPTIEQSFALTVGCAQLPAEILKNVQIVDNLEKIVHFTECIKNSGNTVIGLDSEWRPQFMNAEKIALLQVAVGPKIFLMDFIALEKILSIDEWKNVLTELFCTEARIKIGFDFGGDLRCLVQTVPDCKELIESQVKNVVCLSALVKQLYSQNSAIISGLAEHRGKRVEEVATLQHPLITGLQNSGIEQPENIDSDPPAADDATNSIPKLHFKLSDLHKFLVGTELDKSQQFSNWAKRPLRQAQVHYAAMDAYCQLQIFENLKAKSLQMDLNFSKALKESTVGVPRIKHKTGHKRRKHLDHDEFMAIIEALNAATLEDGGKVKSPKEFRFFVDRMAGALCKHLRRCGVDCLMLPEDRRTPTMVAQAVKEQDRIILSSGKAYAALVQVLSSEFVVCIPYEALSQGGADALSWVLEHFRIKVSESDLFSVCIRCNSRQFLHIPSPYMQIMYESVVAPNDIYQPKPFDFTAAVDTVADVAPNNRVNGGATVYYEQIDGIYGTELQGKNEEFMNQKTPDRWVSHFGSTDNTRTLTEDCNLTAVDLLTSDILNPDGTPSGVFVHIDRLDHPVAVLQKYDPLYACKGCGKIYYDGTHLRNYKEKISNIKLDE